MQKSPFFKIAVLSAGALIMFCWSLSPAETGNKIPGPVAELKKLGEKIDSLEVEKQAAKRNGLPIADLDAKTSALRDSIKTLRQALGQGTALLPVAVPPEKESALDNLKKLLPGKKKSIFDRVLLAAGGVTVVIGIFFLFVLLSLKSSRRKQAVARTQAKKAAAQYGGTQPPAKRDDTAARSAFPDSFANSDSESAALASLIPPPVPETPIAPPATQSRIPVQQQSDIQDMVLKASSEGLDPKEISRRCQISIDQVALILKMAKKRR